MDCTGFQRNLGAWLDGKADEPTREALRVHTLGCHDCRLLHRTRQQLRALVNHASSDEALPRFVTSLLAQHAADRTRK